MFVIAKLQDDVRVPAAELGKARYVAVSRVIEELYFNKVIPDVVSNRFFSVHPCTPEYTPSSDQK